MNSVLSASTVMKLNPQVREGLKCSSAVENFPSMRDALGLAPSTTLNKKPTMSLLSWLPVLSSAFPGFRVVGRLPVGGAQRMSV